MASPRAVVVGTGFGARVHVPALRAAGFEVAALVGTDPDRTQRRADRLGTEGTTDLTRALEGRGVVGVTVATPPDSHAGVVRAAVDRGLNVICEKPFCLDASEATDLRDRAVRSGVVAWIGHEFRFSPERALLERLLSDGAIGEPRVATSLSFLDMLAHPAARMPAWWFDPDRGGGWLGASGSHAVDQALLWLGEPDWVAGAATASSDRVGAADDGFSAVLGFPSGAIAALAQSAGSHGPPSGLTRVAGTAGSLWLQGGQLWLADRTGARRVQVPGDLAAGPVAPQSSEPMGGFTHLELGPYTAMLGAWLGAVEGRDPGRVRPADFSDGVACMKVLDAIRAGAPARARQTGSPVSRRAGAF